MSSPTISFTADPMQPDIYNDVCDLPSPFQLNIPIAISNTHPTQTLYFKASIVSPPSDYTSSSTNLGGLAHGAVGWFFFTPIRNLPTLAAGEYDETLTFRIDAYTDSGYTVTYTNKTLAVTIHHFNHADGSFTVLNHAGFDDSTWGGWTNQNGVIPGTQCGLLMLTNYLFLAAKLYVKELTVGYRVKGRKYFGVFEGLFCYPLASLI